MRCRSIASSALAVLFSLWATGCVDLSLPPSPQRGAFSGTLDTGGHLPLADNEVRLVRTDSPGRITTTTDAEGKFGFAEQTVGLYQVQIDLPGFAPLREGPFELISGAVTDVGVMKPAWLGDESTSNGTFKGLVVVDQGTTAQDGGSKPSDAQGAAVTFLIERAGTMPARVGEATVNAYGQFVSPSLPPGTYTIRVTHPYYISAEREHVELTGAGEKDLSAEPFVLQINPSTITGRVVLEIDRSADAGIGDTVLVTSDTGKTTTTTSDGVFSLTGLPAGARALTFQRTGYHDNQTSHSITLLAGETRDLGTVKLMLDRGDITGLVEMSDGTPIQQVVVDVPGLVGYATQVSASTTTPSQGRFLLAGLPIGIYTVRASRPSYVAAQSSTVTVRANAPSDVGTLRLARIQGDFLIDDGDPTNTPGFTRTRDVTLQLTSFANAAQFRVATSLTALSTASYQPFVTNKIPYTLTAGDELKEVYLQVKDTSNNDGAPLSSTIVLDTQGPTNTSIALAGGAGFTRVANPLPVTLNAADALAGVAFVRLSAVNDADAGVELSALRFPYVRDTSFTRPTSADGVQQVFAQFIDNAGNASDVIQASIVIDTQAPTGTITISRGQKASVDGYTNSLLVDVVETPGGTEPNGGTLSIKLANDAADLTLALPTPVKARAAWFLDAQGEGTKTVHYQFVDSAGNQSGAGQATIIYDATPPVISATLVSPTPTNNPTVTLSLSAVETNPYSPDAGLSISENALFSNAQETAYPSNSQATFTVAAPDGPKTVYVRARDVAGNEGTNSVHVDLDTTAPSSVGISLTGTLADGTSSTTLTSSATVTVNLSHVGATRVLFGDSTLTNCPPLDATYRVISANAIANHPLPGAGATRTVVACFADGAGNVAAPVSASIDFDGAAPTGCQLALVGERADGTPSGSPRTAQRSISFTLAGCAETPLEIAVTEATLSGCTATTAGLVWSPYDAVANSVTLSSVDGAKTVRGCVRDAARNTVAFTAGAITLDTSPPTNPKVVINGGAAALNATQVDGGVAIVSVHGTAVGATEWALAEEGTTPSTFVDFTLQNPLSLSLSAGDGVKGVRALFRDDLGNTTLTEAADTIEVDTTPPQLISLSLVGALADGTPSGTDTTTTEVTASLVQTGATTVLFGDASMSSCSTTGHAALIGTSARVILTGTGTTRTVKACVGDAAGNVSSVLTATIDVDSVGPSGCALALTGLRADNQQPTTGAAATKTGRRDVQYALPSCTETPKEIFLTEGAVSCAATASIAWTTFNAAAVNSFTLGGFDGPKTVRGCVRDAARNTAALTPATITLDTQPPQGPSVSIDSAATWVNAAQKASRGNVNRASIGATAPGAVEWAIAENATPLTFSDLSSSNPQDFTFSTGDGVKTIQALFRDDVGNTTVTLASDSIEFDTSAPTVTSVSLEGPLADGTLSQERTTSTSVYATLIQSGASAISFSSAAITDCSGATFASYPGGTVQTTLGAPAPTERCTSAWLTPQATPQARCKTRLRSTAAARPAATLVMSGKRADGSATALDKTALRDVSFTLSGCAEQPVEVFLTEAPTVSCVTGATLDWRVYNGTTDSFTLSAVDNTKTVRGCVRDAARNVSSIGVDSITLDTTPPQATSVSIKAGAQWFNAADFVANTPDSNSMPVTGTASGATEWALAEGATPSSFVAFTSPQTATFAFSTGDGTKTIRALFRDDVGNTSISESIDTIDVDTVAPTLSTVKLTGTRADGDPSESYTTTPNVTVTLTHTGGTQATLVDAAVTSCPTSGYAALSGALIMALPGSGAVRNAKACIADAAGNTAGPIAAAPMTVDASLPSGCALVLVGKNVDGSPTSGATVNKTARVDVGVTLSSCTEVPVEIFITESSTFSCTPTAALDWRTFNNATMTLSIGDGAKTVHGCVRDAAHNVDSFVSDSITLDTTPPQGVSVVIKGDAPYFNHADFVANTPDSNAASVTGTASGAVAWAISETAAPSSFNAFSSPTTTSFTFSTGDGTKTIRAVFRDDVGNVSAESTDSIIVDTVAPTLTSLTLNGTLADGSTSTSITTSTSVTASLVHSDGAFVLFGDSTLSTCPATGYVALTGNLAATTLTGSGTTRTVKACITDVAGNVAGPALDTIDVDSSPPGGCALTLVGRRVDGNATTGSAIEKTALRDVGVSVSCPEAVEVSLTEGAVTCNDTTPLVWVTLASNTPFTLSAVDGLKTVRGCVRDAALNVNNLVNDTITLDTTPPVSPTVTLKGGATYFNLADFVANTPDSNAMAVTGTATGAAEWAIAEDATPLTFNAFVSPTTSTLTFSSGDGTKTVRALFRDDVGNVTPIEVLDTIEVDTVVPSLSSISLQGTLADGLPSADRTVSTSVEVSLVHSGATQVYFGDASLNSCPLSGYVPLTGASMPVTLTGSTTTRTVKACVSDAAGNSAGPVLDTIDVDSSNPTGCALILVGKRVDGTATADGTANKTARQDVTATLTGCTETPTEIFLTEAALGGCSANSPFLWEPFTASTAFTLSSVDNLKTVRGCVRDAAHNVSSFVADDIALDTTAPQAASVTLHGGAAYFNNAAFVANTPDSNSMSVVGTASGASEWALSEGSVPNAFVAFTSPQTTTFAISSGDGTKTIRALFRDDVGNTTALESTDTIEVDTSLPTFTTLLLTGSLADGTNSTTVSNTLSVTATLTQSGGTQVYFSDATLSACPSSGYSDFDGTSAPVTLTGSSNPRTVKACVTDAAGNTAGPVSDQIDFDSAAPTGCQLVLTGRNVDGTATAGPTSEKTALRDVGVSLNGCSDSSATDVYLTEGSVTCNTVNSFDWVPLNAATTYTLTAGEGSKLVRGCLRDAIRNVQSFTQDSITLDTTPPTSVSVTIKGGAGYFNLADFVANTPDSNAMSISGSATGAVSWAIAENATPSAFTSFATTNPQTFAFSTGDGTKTIRALFRDDVGNVTTFEAQDSIEVDTVPPTLSSISLSGTRADGATSDTWTITSQVSMGIVHTGGVGVAIGDGTLSSCPTSGYASFGGASASITLPGTGTSRTVRACISDAAGNTAGYSEDSISIDSTSPSGCALTLVGRRTDGTSTALTVPEKTALTLVGVSLGSCSEVPADVFLTEAATVNCLPTASLSWQSYTAGSTNFVLTGGDNSKTVRGCVRDSAGNVGSATFDTITLDTQPPTGASVSLHSGAGYFNRAAFLANTPNSNRMNVTGTATGASEWAIAEGAVPSTFNAFVSPTTTAFTISSGEGTKTIRALFRDDVGNTTPTEILDTIEVDTVNPTLTAIVATGTLNDGSASTSLSSSTSVTVTLTQTDGTLVAVGDSSFSCPSAIGSFSAFNGSTTTATLTDVGSSRTVRACVSDAAGNTSATRSFTIGFDNTAPTGCVLTLVGRRVDGSSTAGTVPEKTALTAIGATLTGCTETPADVYMLEGAAALTCPTAGSALWQSLNGSTSTSLTLSAGDTTKTVRACVRDAARNVITASFADTIGLDTTPPQAAGIMLHAGAGYFNLTDFTANTPDSNRMSVTGSATGATEWAFAENTTPTSFQNFGSSPSTVSLAISAGDGTKTVRALFRDDVGNTTPAESIDTIEVDTAAPVLSQLTLIGTLGDGTTSTVISNDDDVTVNVVQGGGTRIATGDSTFVCPTSLASFSAFNGNTAEVVLGGTGTTRTVKVCVADEAGNTSNTRQDSIDLDMTTPSGCSLVLTGRKVDGTSTTLALADLTALRDVGISLSGCPDTNVQVALTESVGVTCSNSVALSWMSLASNSTFQVSSGDGSKTVRGCVRDAALNVGSLTFDSITLDTTPPDSTSVSLNSINGYSKNYPMTVSGSANDATEWGYTLTANGTITYSTYSTTPSNLGVTFSAPDGTKTVFARFRDALQNVSPTVSTSVVVDTTLPTAPVLLTVDGQNRAGRLFWDASTDTNGIQRYELLCSVAPTVTPTTVCATAPGTSTDGYVFNLIDKVDEYFAVRAVDNAGNVSPSSAARMVTIGWRRSNVNPGSVYPIRPLDVAIKGSDVYVTFMEIDFNWAGLGGTLKIAVSHDRGQTWSFKMLDAAFGGNRTLAPIAFTDSAVWVATIANDGLATDIYGGEVAIYSSIDRGDTWTNVSNASLSSSANRGKVDSLGLMTSGNSMRATYMVSSSTSAKQINMVHSTGSPSSTSLQTGYATSSSFGNAPYQTTTSLRSCSGNYSMLTMWRDRNTGGGVEPHLRAINHYFAPDTTFDTSEGFVEAITSGTGAGEEVGSFDLACISLPESIQAYVVYNRAPASAWAVGGNGTILKWDDTSWTSTQSPTGVQLNSVHDVWAVGNGQTIGGVGFDTILRWNGSSWEMLQLSTVADGNDLLDIFSLNAQSVYVVGEAGAAIRWDGSSWSAMPATGTTSTLNGVWGTATNNIFAVGNSGTIRYFNGTSWSGHTSGTTNALRAIWGFGSVAWAVGSSGTIRYYPGSGTTWSTQTSGTTATLYSVWGTSTSNVWAVGSSGVVLHYNGTSWSSTTPAGTGVTFLEVSGINSSEVWIAGTSGITYKYNGSSWSPATTSTANSLYSVWGGTSGGGSPNNLYTARKTNATSSFGSTSTIRNDASPKQPPLIWAGGRNVYVLYRDTSERLMLGQSTNEGSSFSQWTTLESGANNGLYAAMSGENSSDVAVAFSDVNGVSFSVMLPSVPGFPLNVSAGVGSASLGWSSVAGVDRYEVDADPDGASPWTNVDYTSTTSASVPTPASGLANFVQVRAVDDHNMAGNTAQLWQERPFTDATLVSNQYYTAPAEASTGGVVAYNDRALVWPPTYSQASEMNFYFTTNYGAGWTSYVPSSPLASTGARAFAGLQGRAVAFFEDASDPSKLKAYTFSDIGSPVANPPSLVTVPSSSFPINMISAKTSVDQTQVVVAYADTAVDLIHVHTMSSVFGFTTRATISTTAANTIGAIEVVKADFSSGSTVGRIVIGWREYSGSDPRNDYIKTAVSTDSGNTFAAAVTVASGDSSPTNGSIITDFNIGSSFLSGSNNGAYTALHWVSAYNDFWNKNSDLRTVITGPSNSSSGSYPYYTSFTLDTERCDSRAIDAFANPDGHYIAYRSESFDGSLSKLKLVYCVADCHLYGSWNKSLIKSWSTNITDQARFVSMTVGTTSSTAYDPAIYILYQEATSSIDRSVKILSRGVHRRAN